MTVKKYYVKKDSTEYILNSFEFSKEGNNAIDTTTMSLSRTYDSIFDIGDDVSIGYHDATDNFVEDFNGDITSKETHEELILVMESYGGRLNRSDNVVEIYESRSPEYIVEDVVTNYTTLIYAGTESTGVTIDRFVISDETAGEVITRILKDLDWQLRVDNSKNLYFEPKGTQTASIILIVGTNAFMEDNWKRNPNRLINECTVIGDNAPFNTEKSFDAGASQTTFLVDYKIVGNVKVTVDGTEKVGGQEGATTTFDYTIDKEQKKIIFETGLSGGEAVIIFYEYEIPIKITAINDSSVTAYGKYPKKITDNTLKTTSDARLLAKKVVSVYGEPVRSGELLVKWDEDIDVGETVQIIDSFNSMDQGLVVVGLTMTYPEGIKKISVGVEDIDILNWNKSMDERVKKLESKQDNTDIVQKYIPFIENLNISQKQGRIKVRTRTIGHSFIIGSIINGKIGTNTDTEDGQQQVIGSAGLGSMTIQSIVNPNDIMIETFNFTTYKDAGNTTATWDTTNEECSFTNGEVAQSLAVYKNTTKTKATLTLEDNTNLSAEMSMDGGNNWESVTIGTEHTFTNTGSELLWRLTASGNATTEWVKIVYID